MTGGQVAALVFAILLLLPGGCFFIVGLGFLFDDDSAGLIMLLVGIVILSVMSLLFWVAFRKRSRPPGTSLTPL